MIAEKHNLAVPHMPKKEFLAKLERYQLNDNMLILSAIEHAENIHGKQIRDDGSPYLNQHIFPVASEVIDYYAANNQKISPEVVAGAILHDTLEDDVGSITEAEFKRRFGSKVHQLVKSLTKGKVENYPGKTEQSRKMARDREYHASLKAASIDAKIIKAADRKNNIFCIHTSTRSGKIREYIRETESDYLPLFQKYVPEFYSPIKERLEKLKGIYLKS